VQTRKPFSDYKEVFSNTENIGSSKMVRFRNPVTNRSSPKKKPTESTLKIAAASKAAVHEEPDDSSDRSSYKYKSESEDDRYQGENASNSDNNDEENEVLEEDEEAEELSEDQAVIDATTADWIQSRIDEIQEEEIGVFKKPTKFFVVCREIEKIRETNNSDDYFRITTDVQAWADSRDVMKVFSSFRGIIEFIIHLHRLYEVPLAATKETAKDFLLLEIMENAIRKCNNRFHNS
jgi:hypothetical protein